MTSDRPTPHDLVNPKHRYVAKRGQHTQAYQCAGGHQSGTHLTLRPELSPKGDKAQNPIEAAQLLPHSGRREGTRTAKHCPRDTHNQGTELAMKVVRQERLELSGGSTPDLLRPPPLPCPRCCRRFARKPDAGPSGVSLINGFFSFCEGQPPRNPPPPPGAGGYRPNRWQLTTRCRYRPYYPLTTDCRWLLPDGTSDCPL